jgi:tripartite ATP-independent transporter DctP family solute receptor
MAFMAEEVEKNSDGKLKIKIYPSSQLGSERECLELLQIGCLDMTKVSAQTLENFAPKLRVLSFPYVFRDRKHRFNFEDSQAGKDLLLESEKYRLRGLCYYDAGSRSFYSKKKPIMSPKDLSGMKIRVMNSNVAVSMVNTFGGSATPISWGELYTSLQQGVVDGAENNPPSFYLSKHYEICKYYTINEHTSVSDVLISGTKTWERLNEQERKWLDDAVAKSVVYQRKLWKASEEEALKAVKENGVEVLYPSKEAFFEKSKDLREMYKEDKTLLEMIEIINKY